MLHQKEQQFKNDSKDLILFPILSSRLFCFKLTNFFEQWKHLIHYTHTYMYFNVFDELQAIWTSST